MSNFNLFTPQDLETINAQAANSKKLLEPTPVVNSKSVNSELNSISNAVLEYFKDSEAELITDIDVLIDYIDKVIASKYCSIDTETTGLDVQYDTIVGSSLYYPGGVEVYLPNKHMVPIFNEPQSNQLTYQQVGQQLQRLVDSKTKCIFANADFDMSMIYKDYEVDMVPAFYFDVLLAWRCLKENERDNSLKGLFNKYVLKGEGDPKKFRDFFSPRLFPFCKPEVAKYYAANDAKITYQLYEWILPFITKTHPKCIKNNLQQISDLVWNVEFPLVGVCQKLHRTGIYLEQTVANHLNNKYEPQYARELSKLHAMVQDISDNPAYATKSRCPWAGSVNFNPDSPKHVSHLCYNMLKLGNGKLKSTDKDVLGSFELPITNQILKCRSLAVLINTFVKKLPKSVASDSRIHCTFKQIGADTGRMSSANPNMQNIPSKVTDIRRMFRATPGYVLMSSDFSAQEPRITAYCSNDEKMIEAFQAGKDIYGSIGSIAFGVPYEDCLEYNSAGEYNVEGKKRRDSIKTVLLGAMYGRSIETIADQLYGKDDTLTREQVRKKGQAVYDAVMFACPALRQFMVSCQSKAKQLGYVETILGRRRHIPDMQLPQFEFYPLAGYVNPDIDPLDIDTLDNKEGIPDRVIAQLVSEFSNYKYFGQIMKRTRDLHENHKIKVINNYGKITEASRQCVNSVVQGSAADQTKLAMLYIDQNAEWSEIGARLLLPVHDELIAEVPIEHWERGVELLSGLMCKSAEFLPFPSKCDVKVSYRWYGLDYPCKYKKPNSLNILSQDEQGWVQYHLFEAGYYLPITDEGLKAGGDCALGVDGKLTEEHWKYIKAYCRQYMIAEDEFIEHIYRKVHLGA